MLATIDTFGLFLRLAFVGILLFTIRPWHEPRQWRGAPAELQVFLWFSFGIMAIESGLSGLVPDLREAWTPYLGRGAMFVYLICPFLAMQVCRERQNRQRLLLIGFLGFWAVLTLIQFWLHLDRLDETEPYRRVSPYQPVWTVLVPLIWTVVLLSPRVKRYCLPPRAPVTS